MKKYLVILLSLIMTFTMVFGATGMVYAEGDSAPQDGIMAEDPQPTEPENPEPVSIATGTVALAKTVYKYDGAAKEPGVTVTLEDGSTLDPANYTVSYANNIEVGTATATVTAKEDAGYTGTLSAEFYILGKMNAPTLVSKGTTSIKISWEKYTAGPADGYMVYEYDKDQKTNTLIKTITKLDTTTCTIKGLVPGSTHRLRIAVYKKDTATGNDEIGTKSSYRAIETNKVSLKKAVIDLEYNAVAYDGKSKKPAVLSVTLADGTEVPADAYTVTYSDNKASGWGKVTVTPNEDSIYKDIRTKTFYIVGKLPSPWSLKRGTKYITLQWEKHPGTKVEGYKVYRMFNTGEFKLVKTVKGVKETSYKVANLKSKRTYKFKVAAYTTDAKTGKTVIGKLSSYKAIKTLPLKPAKQEVDLDLEKPYIVVDWNKMSTYRATSFELKYATDSSYSDAQVITIKNDGEVDSYTLKGLKDNIRYYVKVRALNKYGDYTAKGKWSDTHSMVAKTSGWCTINGRKYYYRYGSPIKGSQIINGERYYFDGTTGECHGATSVVWDKVKNVERNSDYLVSICVSRHRINVFQNVDDHWAMVYQWSCTTGLNDKVTEAKQYTPRGNFAVRFKVKTFGDTYSVWYATNFAGPYYIHSILYEHGSMSIVQDGRLGINASHGCVRTSLSHAKWIYENVKKGSPVISTFD